MKFEEAIEKVLGHEGGYVFDPTDRGGETNWGISKRAYPDLNIKNLTREQAIAIYKKDYWNASKCDQIPADVRYIHFDTAVNMGLRAAAKLLQRSIGGIAVDGNIGPQTLAKSVNTNKHKYGFFRLVYYNEIIGKDRSQVKYINGWTTRVREIVEG